MIAYFDTSALIPLLIDEPGSVVAERFWDDATRIISSRLIYPEARAAIARARRMERVTSTTLGLATKAVDHLIGQIDIIELGAALALRAGNLAKLHELRGYDAVHLASAEQANDEDLVLVAGDASLVSAARSLGLETGPTFG